MSEIKSNDYTSKSLGIDVIRTEHAVWNNLTATHDGQINIARRFPVPSRARYTCEKVRDHVSVYVSIIYVTLVRVCVLKIQWGQQQYLTQSEIPLFMDL